MRRKPLLWCPPECEPGEAVGLEEKGLLENNPEMACNERSPKLSPPNLATSISRAGRGRHRAGPGLVWDEAPRREGSR